MELQFILANYFRFQSQILIHQVLCKMLSNYDNFYEKIQGQWLVLIDFVRVFKFAKKKWILVWSCLSVRTSAWNISNPAGRSSVKFILGLLWQEKSKFCKNRSKIQYFTESGMSIHKYFGHCYYHKRLFAMDINLPFSSCDLHDA